MMMLRFGALALATMLLLIAAPAPAQSSATPPKEAVVQARIREIRARMLREQVGLAEAKARSVEAVMDDYQGKRRKLEHKLRGHRRALAGLLQQDSEDQAAYAREIQGLRETRRRLLALREQEIDAIQKVLTPKEQAKLGATMEQMKRRVQQAVRRHRPSDEGSQQGEPPPAR